MVSSRYERYEHASLILTSNSPFTRWGDVLGDQVVAAALIDRIVHDTAVITLKGSSRRLKNSGIDTLPWVGFVNGASLVKRRYRWTPD